MNTLTGCLKTRNVKQSNSKLVHLVNLSLTDRSESVVRLEFATDLNLRCFLRQKIRPRPNATMTITRAFLTSQTFKCGVRQLMAIIKHISSASVYVEIQAPLKYTNGIYNSRSAKLLPCLLPISFIV